MSLSLSPSHYSACVFVLRTHTLPEVWVFLRLEWALNPYAVPGTVCHGLALPVTPPVLAQSSARDDPVPAPTSPMLPLALLLTQTNNSSTTAQKRQMSRKDWLCFYNQHCSTTETVCSGCFTAKSLPHASRKALSPVVWMPLSTYINDLALIP